MVGGVLAYTFTDARSPDLPGRATSAWPPGPPAQCVIAGCLVVGRRDSCEATFSVEVPRPGNRRPLTRAVRNGFNRPPERGTHFDATRPLVAEPSIPSRRTGATHGCINLPFLPGTRPPGRMPCRPSKLPRQAVPAPLPPSSTPTLWHQRWRRLVRCMRRLTRREIIAVAPAVRAPEFAPQQDRCADRGGGSTRKAKAILVPSPRHMPSAAAPW